MEALRSSLVVPTGATILMTLGCIDAMKRMIGARYSVKDDKGNSLLPHPYQPWNDVPKEHKQKADDAYRAFKMFENVKEWTLLSLPLMWASFVFSGGMPYMTETYTDVLIGATSFMWMYGNAKYVTGYMESPDARVSGFKIRMKATQLWLLISGVSVAYAVLQKVGIL